MVIQVKERTAQPERDDRRVIEREAGKSVDSSSAEQGKKREADMEESGEENAA
jgi:hypothetical protein